MKKLLGLIGTITIAGSGMVGLVGNAPTPAKKEVNYLQTSNLKQLKRNKRDWWTDSIWDPFKNNVVDPVKKVAKTLVEADRTARNYIQDKAIKVLDNSGVPEYKLLASTGREIKQTWDKVDQWKIDQLS